MKHRLSLKVIQGSIFAGLMCMATLASAETWAGCNTVWYPTDGADSHMDAFGEARYNQGGQQYNLSTITRMVLQKDGNLVVYGYKGGTQKALWATGTSGQSVASAVFQCDGNLVLYNSAGKALWDSGTWGQGGNKLVVQTDGNLVIYNTNYNPQRVIWATNRFQ
jgi:hypothetical protein